MLANKLLGAMAAKLAAGFSAAGARLPWGIVAYLLMVGYVHVPDQPATHPAPVTAVLSACPHASPCT